MSDYIKIPLSFLSYRRICGLIEAHEMDKKSEAKSPLARFGKVKRELGDECCARLRKAKAEMEKDPDLIQQQDEELRRRGELLDQRAVEVRMKQMIEDGDMDDRLVQRIAEKCVADLERAAPGKLGDIVAAAVASKKDRA